MVISNRPEVAKAVAKHVSDSKTPLKTAIIAEDRGVSTRGGGTRTVKSLNKRLRKRDARAKRVGFLSKTSSMASSLFVTGVRPQQEYEEAIIGATPGHVQHMRRSALKCLRKAGTQPCATTTLRWRLDEQADPAVRIVKEQIRMWADLWEEARKDAKEENEIRQAWREGLKSIVLANKGWRTVTGPLEATICVLRSAGWHAVGPGYWPTPDKEACATLSGKSYETTAIAEAVAQTVEERLWEEAACHHLGKGLDKGPPDLDPTKKARKVLLKRGAWAEVAALDAAVCGGAWHHGRAGQKVLCHRCQEEDTAWHRYWGCPKLRDHDSDEVRKSEWLKSKFENELAWAECLWGRAIAPVSVGSFKRERDFSSEREEITSDNFYELAKKARSYGTDGSGGPAYVPRPMRRCASTVVQIHHDNLTGRIEEVAVKASDVAGKQTVPREELWASILAQQAGRMNENANSLTTLSDSSYVVKGAAKKDKDALKTGGNGDLWEEWEAGAKTSHTTCKVKAHAEDEVVLGQIGCMDYVHNALADAAADAYATHL